MSPELIKQILSVIICIAIVVFIAKKAIRAAIVIGVALFLFQVAFVWNGDTINEKLKLKEHLNPEAAAKVEDFFKDFAQKRDEYGVIVDSEEVYNSMVDGVKAGTEIIVDGLGKINIKKFSDVLAEEIYNAGSENIDWDALKEEISKQLGGISDDDRDKIVEEIKLSLQEKEENGGS